MLCIYHLKTFERHSFCLPKPRRRWFDCDVASLDTVIFLATAQKLDLYLLSVLWHPDPQIVACGGTSHIDKSVIYLQLSFALEIFGFVPDAPRYNSAVEFRDLRSSASRRS